MAKTNHKLYIKGSNGTIYIIPLYTSTNDLKNKRGYPIQVKDGKNNLTLYFPVGDVGDPEQTPARLKLKNGTTVSILKTGTTPYTQTLLTNKNSDKTKDYTGSFTVPAGVSRIRIALCTSGNNIGKVKVLNNEGYYDEESTYIEGRDVYFGGISATKEKQKSYVWGCKPAFSFSDLRNSSNSEIRNQFLRNPAKKQEYYGLPRYSVLNGEKGGGFYYSGYIDVKPNQTIKYGIGGIDKHDRGSEYSGLYDWNCGFILIAYGVGIEK